MREAIRECPYSLSADMLRGREGALAPIKELEGHLLKRSRQLDLEGDPYRRYFFFDAKNRSSHKPRAVDTGFGVWGLGFRSSHKPRALDTSSGAY
jgi:hypothetical protein